jgi:Arylsulfotransferase (ASST)
MRSSSATVGRAIASAATLLGVFLAAGCGAAADPVVSVYPIPGARVASPQTQIAFRGLPVKQLGKLTVTGSRSGRHGGRVVSDSDGRGGSFLPARPFVPGEVVTVRTKLHVRAATAGAFRFTVANPSGPVPSMPLNAAPRVPGDELTFRSRPDLTPASVEVTKQSSDAASGDIFITPQQGPTQNGAMILSPSGQLIWFHPVPHGDMAADLHVQNYLGRPVLTWWEGYSGAGIGAGEDMVYDASYRQVAVVRAGNGLSADLHEFRLTPQGTALITAYYPVYWDASSVHGPSRQVVLDSVLQEIDLKTGLVLYQWDSLDHVPLLDSREALPQSAGSPFDYFHINSVQQQRDGDLLVSARNTWAAYEIDPSSGAIVWTLGGKNSSYRLGSGVTFAFQHDVRLHTESDPTVTLFDDGAGPPKVHTQSRGITVRLDDRAKTATLVSEDLHSPALAASFEGNVQALANGDEFLGWGQQPYFSEFDSEGDTVFDGRFVDSNSSYRAYRFPWTGTPRSAPDVAAAVSGGTAKVYASWNGATEVASWRVLAGPSVDALRAVVTAPKDGFETEVAIAGQAYVAVQALDGVGRTLATSAVVRAM